MDWNSTLLCPTGLSPWAPGSNNIAPCFQQLFLQIPVAILFAIISSYHCGRKSDYLVVRNKAQKLAIKIRLVAVFTLGLIPLFQFYDAASNDIHVWPIDLLVGCVQLLAFFVHLGFLLTQRLYGDVSQRGPLSLGVIWCVIFLLNIIWIFEGNPWPRSYLAIVMHAVYACTLIPSGEAEIVTLRQTQEDERAALLGNAYIRFQDSMDENILGEADDGVGFLSKMIFYWVNPLIKKGIAGKLKKVDDLFDLPESLNIACLAETFFFYVGSSRSLFRALHKSFCREFYSIGLLRLTADMSGFAGPLLLGGLLTNSENADGNNDTIEHYQPYLYALGLFGSTLLAAVCGTHFNWRMSIITMKMRISLVSQIYSHSLAAKTLSNSPDILNLMSTDVDRIVNSCISFHSFWSIPFQLFITLYLLYTQIGSAFIAGVVFAVALIPINRFIAVKIGTYSQKLMGAKDDRVSITSEALTGVKQIKLLAWEEIFIKKIQSCRMEELKFLSKRKYLDALCVYFWATTPVLMCLLTFGVSVLLGHPLTAASTFTSVALLNMLIGPLNAFPWVLNGLIEAWVSLKRVQELIDVEDIDLKSYYSVLTTKNSSRTNRPTVFTAENACFEFDEKRNRLTTNVDVETITDFKLDNVNIDVRQGELICIEGPVGGGKSSLLMAIMAEMKLSAGTVSLRDVDEGFGYVSQNPWLQRGTIRENIIWGSVYDEIRYKKVLFACALLDDIAALGGDEIGVGEGGRTLSGGQRARVALARAVYQDKKCKLEFLESDSIAARVYLLDDVLAAVDTHVAKHIIKHCLLDLLKHTTRLIVTENRVLTFHANHVLHVGDGTVRFSEVTFEDYDDDGYMDDCETPMNSEKKFNEDVDEDRRSLDSVMLEETKEFGTLSSHVLTSYWKATGGCLGFMVLLSVVLMQVTRNLSDAWLAHWVSSNTTQNSTDSTEFYLKIYTSIAVTNSIVTFVRAFLFAYAGIKAAKFVHNKLLTCVFYAKFYFFDVTPLGRLLNRFSSDTYTVDDSLPFILNIFLAQLVGLIGAISISIYAMPWLGLLIVPLCPIYLSIQSRYRQSSRDIKRLSSNALSPLYSHFTETLQGLTTIRAMRHTKRFKRDFAVKLEESIRAQLTSAAAQQWLALRLQFVGCVLVGGSGVVAVITSAHLNNPGMVGLAISYSLSITGLLGGVLSAFAETEQEFVAVERVGKYCSLEPEVSADGSVNPPFGWPCQGVISFKDVSLKYRDHLLPSLVDISLETSACERLGIVGRTGAGKSSILSALMRVAPLSAGRITIDCVDIATLPLNVLRNRIALVPQEPLIFAGTIRENLDPSGLHLDSSIWNAINQCLATPLVQSLGGLSAELASGGSNLSSGQKQLLCLARAFLKNSKIVCIDEGTANLDNDSETAIQLVLRSAFRSSTVLLISHRLTLQQTDRIIVMDHGQIIEQGHSTDLANDSNSLFHGMLLSQGIRNFNRDTNGELL
ncbi:ATP-binding cassette sub-family C member 10 [Pseudolycoriella hygida]|uniref:ABC-type xenobiotic transporter n=1 Tax=Pseudolycoriella hygida TaxID=35572 RepID=A0A9Q0NDH8_9DIPT|nr:ATP-binding cassette sub-family C member 10 [Pseudolycoriella hygida]